MYSLKFFLIVSIVIISLQCEDNDDSQNSASDCGLEATFIKDVDNIYLVNTFSKFFESEKNLN